jgi:hypothetical protein
MKQGALTREPVAATNGDSRQLSVQLPGVVLLAAQPGGQRIGRLRLPCIRCQPSGGRKRKSRIKNFHMVA